MNKHSTNQAKKPELLAALQQLLAGMRGAFKQERTYRRAQALFVAELLVLGRHTVTQLLRGLGLVTHDWSAWYRLFSEARFEEAAVAAQLVQETLPHVPQQQAYVVTLDGVIVPRTGVHVAGSSWWRGQKTAAFRRGLQRGQRFVELAWLTPEEQGYCRAVPLRWLPAVTAKATPSIAEPCKEWEAGVAEMHWTRAQLDQQGRAEQWLTAVADGNYDVQAIWGELPARTVLVARTASNRKLFALAPEPTEAPGPGRPALYGERLPTPNDLLHRRQHRYWTTCTLLVRGRQRELQYQVQGPCLLEGMPECPVFAVVVRGQNYWRGVHRRYRKPYYMLVNAVLREGEWQLPFPVPQLLAWAWQRWECEVAHREMKSAFGIGEKQCWSQRAALRSVQWGVWVYGTCLLAAYRAWGITGGPRRAGRWYSQARRWSFSSLWQAYRAALWGKQDFFPLYSRSLANWLKPELWLTGLGNALADPGRI
ncbi:MAG: hypothetical protein RBT47_03285 [Anaerolineae bacterium]|jgi:hypothetical protein|nr:hypothetical protein [Anaerolineae bacterium]